MVVTWCNQSWWIKVLHRMGPLVVVDNLWVVLRTCSCLGAMLLLLHCKGYEKAWWRSWDVFLAKLWVEEHSNSRQPFGMRHNILILQQRAILPRKERRSWIFYQVMIRTRLELLLIFKTHLQKNTREKIGLCELTGMWPNLNSFDL